MERLLKRLRKHKDSKHLTQKSKSKDAGSPPKPTRTNKDTSSESTRKPGETVCPSDECGKTISIPLKVIGQSEEQSYYACPYCLSKLDSTNAKQKDFAEQSPFKNLAPPKKADPEETEDTAKCSHYFGYLREHPKYIPIPDECLTCPKATKCLLG